MITEGNVAHNATLGCRDNYYVLMSFAITILNVKSKMPYFFTRNINYIIYN